MIPTIRKKKNRFLSLLLILGVIVIVSFLAIQGYLSYLKSPLDPSGKLQAFVVQRGESVLDITRRLEEEKIIRSALALRLSLKTSGKDVHIEAGDFKLSPAMSLDEVVNTLQKGSVDKWVTIIEGQRVEEVADKLNADLGVNKQEFLAHAKEGYMFPDTYLFNPQAHPADIASIMRNTFENRYSERLQEKIKSQGLSPEEGVIIASLVEREARSDKVRTEVASIILKRLKIDMILNIDATVQYALGYQAKEKSWWKKELTYDDLKIDSPYNTYIHSGLPPTPICNPSLSALNAVANANINTPYLYYYHDAKGNTYYAKTLEEHESNVAAH